MLWYDVKDINVGLRRKPSTNVVERTPKAGGKEICKITQLPRQERFLKCLATKEEYILVPREMRKA
jgi:hypothetical protein